MSKISPREARAILVAAGLVKPDSFPSLGAIQRVLDSEISRKNAIEQRKRTFKQASDIKKGN